MVQYIKVWVRAGQKQKLVGVFALDKIRASFHFFQLITEDFDSIC